MVALPERPDVYKLVREAISKRFAKLGNILRFSEEPLTRDDLLLMFIKPEHREMVAHTAEICALEANSYRYFSARANRTDLAPELEDTEVPLYVHVYYKQLAIPSYFYHGWKAERPELDEKITSFGMTMLELMYAKTVARNILSHMHFTWFTEPHHIAYFFPDFFGLVRETDLYLDRKKGPQYPGWLLNHAKPPRTHPALTHDMRKDLEVVRHAFTSLKMFDSWRSPADATGYNRITAAGTPHIYIQRDYHTSAISLEGLS